jgi:predicted transcriptional regulator
MLSILPDPQRLSKGCGQTELMYSAQMSPKQFKEILKYLLENELIDYQCDKYYTQNSSYRKRFYITTHGKIYIKLFASMLEEANLLNGSSDILISPEEK